MTVTTDLVEICDQTATARDLERAAVHLADWVGIVLATRGSAPERAFGAAAGLERGALSGFGAGAPEAAAFGLGALGSLLEMDDLHRRSILHAGDVVCPAALVAARDAGATGQTLLRALLAGYEVALRIGVAAATGGYSAWYNSAACGVFGAAMAAARADGLGAQAQAHALGHAGMQAAGLWQCRLEPGHAKQLAAGHAARAGITAARAARAGIGAPLEILEGPLGVFATMYPGSDPAGIAQARGDWALHEVSLKPWSACRHVHPAIAAALELRARGVVPARIEVATYAAAIAFCDAPAPQDAHSARFSLQHCVATAMVRGAPARADFEDPARRDAPEIAALRARVHLVEDPGLSAAFPGAYGATLRITNAGGAVHTAHAPHAPGDPEAPLAPEAIEAKFLTNCRDGGVPDPAARALHEALRALPAQPDLTALSAALRGATHPEGDPHEP